VYGPRDVCLEERSAATIVHPTDAVIRIAAVPATGRTPVAIGRWLCGRRPGWTVAARMTKEVPLSLSSRTFLLKCSASRNQTPSSPTSSTLPA
jgi:hypothetical protein